MPLVNSKTILAEARRKRYGIPSLLAGGTEMIIGQIKAAEAKRSPLILAFNQKVTPKTPLALGLTLAVTAARQAQVPVATILDHGHGIEDIMQAIQAGTSSVMFDGSHLPYEENVRQTREIVKIAHAVGVCVEAELGGIAGSSIDLADAGPESRLTDPDQAADFVAQTGVDVLAISFGNAHGVYQGQPELDLERVQKIHARVDIPLAMHGASGLAAEDYPRIISSGISKICYYTAMARGASQDLKQMLVEAEADSLIYHNIINRAIDYFCAESQKLFDLVGAVGVIDN